jgi:hypothetical protein
MKTLRQQYQLPLIRNLVEVGLAVKVPEVGLTVKVPEVEIVEQKILALVMGVQKVFVVCLILVVVEGVVVVRVVVVELKQVETQNDIFYTLIKFSIFPQTSKYIITLSSNLTLSSKIGTFFDRTIIINTNVI